MNAMPKSLQLSCFLRPKRATESDLGVKHSIFHIIFYIFRIFYVFSLALFHFPLPAANLCVENERRELEKRGNRK